MTDIHVLVIEPDNAADPEAHNVARFDLIDNGQATMDAVGGYVQAIPGHTFGGWLLLCDEDAKSKGLPLNWTATAVAQRLGLGLMPGDILRGRCLFVGTEGQEFADFPPEATAEVIHLFGGFVDAPDGGQ